MGRGGAGRTSAWVSVGCGLSAAGPGAGQGGRGVGGRCWEPRAGERAAAGRAGGGGRASGEAAVPPRPQPSPGGLESPGARPLPAAGSVCGRPRAGRALHPPPWGSRGARRSRRAPVGKAAHPRPRGTGERRGEGRTRARGTWCPRWPHVGGPLSPLSAQSRSEPSRCVPGGCRRCAEPALRAPWAPQVGGGGAGQSSLRVPPPPTETLRPRPGAARSWEEGTGFRVMMPFGAASAHESGGG